MAKLPDGTQGLVLDVNSSPGLEGIESHAGVDVAGEIVSCVEEHPGRGTSRERTRGRGRG